MTPDERLKSDLMELLKFQSFSRFLLRAIQLTGFFETATDGSHGGAVERLARRNLGLELLAMVESGQPAQHPDGIPVLTMLQILREEATQPLEKPNAKSKNGRTAELDDEDSSD